MPFFQPFKNGPKRHKATLAKTLTLRYFEHTWFYLRSRLGLLLPEKYESIFDVSSKGPSSGSLVNKDGGRENTRFYIMNKSRDKIKTNEMDFNQNKV